MCRGKIETVLMRQGPPKGPHRALYCFMWCGAVLWEERDSFNEARFHLKVHGQKLHYIFDILNISQMLLQYFSGNVICILVSVPWEERDSFNEARST